jgi:hypothetical protein
MGWTGAALPAAKLIAEEVGAANIVAKAWGPSSDGERTCWLHLRGNDHYDAMLAVALVRSERRGDDTWNYVKIVTETMGPGDVDVPDKIWDNRPPTPADSEWATEWRARVETFRAKYPDRVAELTDADIGAVVELPLWGDYTSGRYLGRVRTSKTVETPLFEFNGRRHRVPNWRTLRCGKALVTA